jgi:hypothetical protein
VSGQALFLAYQIDKESCRKEPRLLAAGRAIAGALSRSIVTNEVVFNAHSAAVARSKHRRLTSAGQEDECAPPGSCPWQTCPCDNCGRGDNYLQQCEPCDIGHIPFSLTARNYFRNGMDRLRSKHSPNPGVESKCCILRQDSEHGRSDSPFPSSR